MHLQGDSAEQKDHRDYRNVNFAPLRPEWMRKAEGGKDLTFARMDDNIKITLIDAMAKAPTFWPPNVTMQKAETKISSDRSNNRKRSSTTPMATPTPKVHVFLFLFCSLFLFSIHAFHSVSS
jgi:hypothetical protein